MKKKRIVYIHHGTGLGGAPLSLLYLIQGLDTTQYDPIVLFLKDSNVIPLFKERGIKTIGPLHLQDFSHTQVQWFRWYQAHHLVRCAIDSIKTILYVAPKILTDIMPDAVHLNTSSLGAWGIVAHRLNIPVIWHIRESLAPGYFGIRRFLTQRIIAQCATMIIPICKADAQPWDGNAKVQVIYNAADTKRFYPAHSAHNKTSQPNILFVGGNAPQKGLLFLLEVFTALRKYLPNVSLTIAGHCDTPNTHMYKKILGRQSYYHALTQRITQNHDAITIIGPTHDIPTLIAQCSVLAFPASVDHFARPVIEASLMAKPSIASDFAQSQEIIIHNKTGFLAPYGDHATWVNTLYTLLTDTTLQQTLGLNAYYFATARFTTEVQQHHINTLYHTILPKD